MAAIARSAPKPIVEQPLISTKTKYRYVRIKEQMLHAIGGRGGGGLFSTDESQPLFGGGIFQPYDSEIDMSSSPIIPNTDPNDPLSVDAAKKAPGQGSRKASLAAV